MEEVPHPSEFTFCWTATTACQHTATALAHSNPPYRGNNPYITDERLTGLPVGNTRERRPLVGGLPVEPVVLASTPSLVAPVGNRKA